LIIGGNWHCAIRNAISARICNFPATPDKLIPALEALND
jgi:hypothetical protein